MNREIATTAATPSASNYAQAVETPPGARVLHVSGQVGARPDGTIGEDAAAQHRLAWANVFAILDAAGMEPADIVEVLAIVTDRSGIATYREIRAEMLGGHRTASTMLIGGLAHPGWVVEIAVRAARAG